MNRRILLKSGIFFVVSVAGLPIISCSKTYNIPGLKNKPNKYGLLLPPGAKSRIIATAGELVGKTNYSWHSAPDGSGIMSFEDGGWLLISNSERVDQKGGVSVIRFSPSGEVADAYSILQGSNKNCGGMVTPWKTWLSCEEVENGVVWECDPFGKKKAYVIPELGAFKHEFIVMDPETGILYLSEDDNDGCFYRFVPMDKTLVGRDYFMSGRLEVAEMKPNSLIVWHLVPDPMAKTQATRYQVKKSSAFKKMEGMAYNNNQVFFNTSDDNKIWQYDIQTSQLSIFYDAAQLSSPVLTGPDTMVFRENILYVAEDDGDMQIVAIDMRGNTKVILQVTGQDKSEVTGIAFSPDKKRMYFNSQRGKSGKWTDGITYEITGLF